MPRLPSSGPLDVRSIDNEFRRGTAFSGYLGTPHDAGNFPTAELSVAHFQGRMAAFQLDHTTQGAQAWNLFAFAQSAGWDGVVPLNATFRVAAGAYVTGDSVANPAIIAQNFPAGSVIVLINHGWIVGLGGAGAIPPAMAGAPGHRALYCRSPITVFNYGVIAGGGGGGAGTGFVAGGGGAAFGPPNGNVLAGGLGQAPGGIYGASRGGNGGEVGTWGEGYYDISGFGPFGFGGQPGEAVDGVGYVSWGVYGDVRGSLV